MSEHPINPLPRLIPTLLLKDGLIVRATQFRTHQIIGAPLLTVRRLSQWNVDELIILNISEGEEQDLRRDDLQYRYDSSNVTALLRQIAQNSSMPVSFGGRIRSVEDVRELLESGADKCVINTQALVTPEIITAVAKRFGSQCLIVAIDVKEHADGRREVFSHKGTQPTGKDPVAWAQEAERLGAGEIFLNSIDRDGMSTGYDLETIRAVTAAVSIPVIACGGVGAYEDFARGILEGGAHAVSAANIFHYKELSYIHAKNACIAKGVGMRAASVGSRWTTQEPVYDLAERDARIAKRLEQAATPLPAATPRPAKAVRWCSNCVYPSISATPSAYDENGVCMGCRASVVRTATPQEAWVERGKLLKDLLHEYRSKDGSRPDCIIPVSGGKDSYFQAHVVREMGFKPLLVTYNGNNYLDVGWRNLMRMREAFKVDHIIYGPDVDLLKKLNRLGLIIMGDMNWHCHVGIMTMPMKIATQLGIPLVIWGEHGYADLCGQFSASDFVEFTYRTRLEHFARGYEWNYFVGLDGITAQDMQMYRYPSDQQIYDVGLRGIYLANYLSWDANDHIDLVRKKYGFEISETPFDRTYRTMSNLDDMHENGLHDYLKYVKFGYGRCSDHASKDIRAGLMTRERGVELVRHYDHVKPSDIARWTSYVGMSEDEFDRIADTYRDKRVWYRQDGAWNKDCMWD